MFHRQERTKLNMIKCNKKIGIIIGIVIIALLMFIHPLLFKKNYIEKIAKIDLPKSANLIDSKFYVDLYGVQLPSVDKGIHAPTAVFWRLAALTSVGVRPATVTPQNRKSVVQNRVSPCPLRVTLR